MQRFTEFDFGVSWVMGFFHQDWCHDGPTAADVVAKNLADVDDEYVLAVRRDTQTLLDGLVSKTLEVLWDAGADYLPSFEQIGEGAQWTRTVVALCDARLSAKAGVRPLAGADVEDGVAQLDAVLAEIEEARFLEADVRAALVDCARRCTPELAFRLLLRAMMVAGVRSLTQEQYARLEAIGSALHHGEFVVDSVRYLVEAE
ncbi:hypothetical protein AB0M41_41420 [Streptomyces sp. NPDC051896]|uniref:hypothetical protein n=1 Tax=Streptomyces sp. NPDC051896 TaxID=3155416 RepID=UPI0034338515